MADIPITGHKYYDALWNREKLVRSLKATLNPDGSITDTPLLITPPEARTCVDSARCLFGHIVAQGDTPCKNCERLMLADYYITK